MSEHTSRSSGISGGGYRLEACDDPTPTDLIASISTLVDARALLRAALAPARLRELDLIIGHQVLRLAAHEPEAPEEDAARVAFLRTCLKAGRCPLSDPGRAMVAAALAAGGGLRPAPEAHH